MTTKRCRYCLCWIVLAYIQPSLAFPSIHTRFSSLQVRATTERRATPPSSFSSPFRNYEHGSTCSSSSRRVRRRTKLHVAPISLLTLWTKRAKPISAMFVFFAVMVATFLFRRRVVAWAAQWLWPGAKADASFSEPLPPGSLGCPWLGSNVLAGNNEEGPEFFYRETSQKLGHPSVFKYYFLGSPVASISGASLVQDLLSKEFLLFGPKPETKSNRAKAVENKKRLAVFGTNNVMFERDKEKHSFLRRLVGSGMSPKALQRALPTIEQTANDSLDAMFSQQGRTTSGTVCMEDLCTDYTMEIVRKQLLGLDQHQSEEERVRLRQELQTWLSALYSIVYNMPLPSFFIRRSKPYKARRYIEAKLEERIDSLIADGPDSSTLSEMVFAVDEDSNASKLTKEQVIENASVLVLAGSETSASTLTLAMLLLGLHPTSFQKLVDEQEKVQSKYDGDAGDISSLTLERLDKECPYLDAIVKETLRLGAVTGGFPRRTRETIVIDGHQIPKGWPMFANIRLTHQLDPSTRLPDDSHMDVHKGFRPERWLDDRTRPSDFIPFGAGPRYCLGSNLAMMEIKVFLALFSRRVQSFQLVGDSVESSIDWNPRSIIPKPADGVEVRVVERKSGTSTPQP